MGAQGAPQSFNFGGISGMVDAMQINGENIESNPEINRKAEEVVKNFIYKHLSNKKQVKKAKAKKVKAAPEPIELIPTSINWDDHPESRAILEEKIPGGTEAVDALIKLIQENEAQH